MVIRENVIINRGIETEGGTRIGSGSSLMANSHVGHDSHIQDGVVIGNNVSIAGDVEIGSNTILSSSVVVHENSKIGEWVLIKGGCRITGNVPLSVSWPTIPQATLVSTPICCASIGGLTEERVDDIAKCYRHLYQTGTSVFNALKRIEADVDESPERTKILEFIQGLQPQDCRRPQRPRIIP